MCILLNIKSKIQIFILTGLFIFPMTLLSQENQKSDTTVVSNKQAKKKAKKHKKQQSYQAANDTLSNNKTFADSSHTKQLAQNDTIAENTTDPNQDALIALKNVL